MKKTLYTLLALLLCISFILPAANISVAAEESKAEGSKDDKEEEEDIWETLKPAYMSTSFKSVEDRLKGNETLAAMELAIVKDGYALYYDKLTGEVVELVLEDPVLNEETGEYEYEKIEDSDIYKYKGYWSSNPYNVGSSQSTAGKATTDSVKEKLYAQLIINYTENDTDMSFNTFTDSAINNQITVKQIRSGIRVEYTIGREEVKYLVPRLIRATKLEDLAAQIAANSDIPRDARQFMAFYKLKDPNDTSLAKKTIEEMKVMYPICTQFPIYVCEPHITAQELLRVERWIKAYTNYSFEEMDADHAETDYTATDKTPALFKMALEYTIDENGLQVRVNAGNIRFDSSNYKLSNVILLPYAGAGNTNNSGYIFSPDGSGTIIKFEDIAGTAFKTTSQLYGPDYAFHTIKGYNKQIARLPAYGIVEIVKDAIKSKDYVQLTDDDGNPLFDENGQPVMSEEMQTVTKDLKIGYLAVIDEGDSLASINVENGGSVHMFASAYTSFNPRPSDTYELTGSLSAGSNAMWTVESQRKYTKDYKIRYFVLTGDDISYSAMANTYRDYLIKKGDLVPKTEETAKKDVPLYLETLGALLTTKKFLGIPMDTMIDLTSFENAQSILDQLKNEAGINNIKLRYKGWCNDGMPWPLVPNGVKVEDALGGEKGFKALVAWCAENGVDLYPDFEFALAYTDTMFDGLNQDTDIAKTIDDRNAPYKQYDFVWQTYVVGRAALITPNAISRMYDKTWADYQKYNVGGISVGTLGDMLTSDFNEDDPLHREDSKTLVTKLLSKIKADNGKVMVSGGNAYTLKYVTDIINVPLDDSRYKFAAAPVPFMGMVLHGSIDFAGEAINLAGDYNYTLLKTIENGASPYFLVAYSNTSEIKQYNWSMKDYYSIRYQIWAEDLVDTYNQVNEALRDLQTSLIVNHEIVDKNNNVCHVTYDNGVSFYINYSLNDYTVTNGTTTLVVPAESFVKLSADGNPVE